MHQSKMRRYVASVLLGAGLLLIGACASSSSTNGEAWTKTYEAGFEEVKRSSAEAIRELGLGMEGRQALRGNGYVMIAYKERGLDTGEGQQMVRGTSLRVHIERRGGDQTHVRIEVPSSGSSGGTYGSERGNTRYDPQEYADAIMRKLDARL